MRRFIQGRGNYLDDITLPGMLHMAILRSPIAHGRIRSIDTSAAQAVEGVVAVVTGELMAAHNLAWMPTLSGDTQAVLATDKVRYQGQEVAAVIATDPYIARDALPLIEVDYEELQPITGPQQSLAEGAVLIRDEKEGQVDNVAYTWESGDQGCHRRRLRQSRQGGGDQHPLSALAPVSPGDVRNAGGCQPVERSGDPLHDLAGSPRPPHLVCHRGRVA